MTLSVLFYVQFLASLMMFLAFGYYQLSALNEYLKKCIKNKVEYSSADVISNVAIMYDEICDAFDAISSFYLLSNLCVIMGLTFYVVFAYYSLYVYLKKPTKELGYFLLSSYLWCGFYSPCVIWMMRLSAWIEIEGLITANLVQILANKENSLKCTKSSIQFALLASHRKPRIFCGLYDLNFKANFALLCSTLSLSIILIQFYDVSND